MAISDFTLTAIRPRVAEFARRSGMSGFWPWWTAQLNAIVPARPRAALERRRMRPVLVFQGDHATLWRPGMDGERVVMLAAADIPLTGDASSVAAAGRAALASLAPAGQPATLPVKVLLSMPPRDVLRKTLALPAAVEPNLRQTLAYDLDRHTPFKAEELYFDAVVVGRMPDTKEIRVDLVSCRKDVVDAALRHASAWGVAVAAAVPETPAMAAYSRLNLLPHEARSIRPVWTRWQFWLPMGLVVVVALAAIAIPLWQKRDYAIALNAAAADAHTQAEVSEKLRAELETKIAEFNFALETKYAFPSAFRVVDEISRVLPDDTWLTQLEMKSIAKGKETQREILLRGESANAGRLVQLFEESSLFAQTAPRSPTTKIQPGPGEIFDLGAQLKLLALPNKVALADAEKPVGVAPPTAATPPPVATTAAPNVQRGDRSAGRRAAANPGESPACRGGGRAGGTGRRYTRPGCRASRRCRCCASRRCSARAAAASSRCACRGRTRPRSARRDSGCGSLDFDAFQSGPATSGTPARDVRRPGQMNANMTPAFVAKLTPPQQRGLAIGLLVLAVIAVLVLLMGPIVMIHRHYDAAIEDTTNRLDLYRRVAAQAPELRAALDRMKQKDTRRFFLRNTAPNLAGAELSDLVRGAIENNAGRITTSQNPAPREEGRFRQTFVTVQFFATTPALAKILTTIDTLTPFVVVDNLTIRPLNAFRGFKPAPGQEPELNVQMDVSAWAFAEVAKVAAAQK